MASNQRPRRRSARLAFADEEEGAEDGKETSNKRSKTGNTSLKSVGKGKNAAYEEEDNGFTFTRTKSRKPKPTGVESKAGLVEESSVPERVKPVRKHKTFTTPIPEEKVERPKRRSGRLSGENRDAPVEVPRVRPRAARSGADEEQGRERTPEALEPREPTKIALPFTDTPVIQRNKAMRNAKSGGSRRSSLGMRGRRASSLIEAGYSAMPHKEVETAEFYKHIASDGLSEPRRMKQLLTWCATRAMGEKPPNLSGIEASAWAAARVIQEELLKDIANRGEMSNWFDREEVPSLAPPLVKKPNPRNIANAQKAQDLERQLAEARAQKALYKTLLPPPVIESAVKRSLEPDLSQIRADALPEDQRAILSTLSALDSLPSSASQQIRAITSTLELQVDTLRHSIHSVDVWREQADRVAGRALAGVATRLEKRDDKILQASGTNAVEKQEVLRALSGLISGDGAG